MKRSDQSVAVYIAGVIGGVIGIGALVLLGLGVVVPSEAWALSLAAVTGLFAWARGGTYYDPSEEKVPAPVLTYGEQIPVADYDELARRQNNDIG